MRQRVDTVGRVMGIDSSHEISERFARWLIEKTPVRFCMRYVRRRRQVDNLPRKKWPVYLSHHELAGLMTAGLPVGIVQTFVGRDMLTREQGKVAGDACAWNAQELGADPDVTIFCDAEWGDERAKAADQPAYLGGWYDGAQDCGGRSLGMYEGSNIGMDGRALGGLPKVTRYWKSLSRVPTVYPRGYCMTQSWEHVLLGDGPETWRLVPKTRANADLGPLMDLNLASQDARGGQARFIVP